MLIYYKFAKLMMRLRHKPISIASTQFNGVTLPMTLMQGAMSQGISALANVLVSSILARNLNVSSFAYFTVVYGLVQVTASIQTSLIGDFLSVHQMNKKYASACNWWIKIIVIISIFFVTVFIFIGKSFSFMESVLCGFFAGAWTLEEYGRRCLIAQMRFVAQALNDLLYLIIAMCLLFSIRINTPEISLASALILLTIAAAGSAILAQPFTIFDYRFWRVNKFLPPAHASEILRFGYWRTLQGATSAIFQVGIRVATIGYLGVLAAASLELARVVAAPVSIILGGIGNVLLPTYAKARQVGQNINRESRKLSLKLGVATIGFGFLIYVASARIGHILFGRDYQLDSNVIASWLFLSVSVALMQPTISNASSLLPQPKLALIRICGTLIGGALSVFSILNHASLFWIPISLSIGSFTSWIILEREIAHQSKNFL